MLAKAIFDEIPLNLCLSKVIYKLILNPDTIFTLDDVKYFDGFVHNSLKYILDNNIDEDEYLELYFQHEFNGKMYPLCINGDQTEVSNDNKEVYVIQKIDFMLKNFTYEQVDAIRKGFSSLISFNLLSTFSESEFQYLCWGRDEIDIQDWKSNTIYSGDYNTSHNVIEWFWSMMDDLDQKSLRIIFQFVTGMSRLPAGGFSALNKNRGEVQYFNIRSIPYYTSNFRKKNTKNIDPYPKSYTCFNRLHLPLFPDEDTLRENLQKIIDQEEVFGFGLED